MHHPHAHLVAQIQIGQCVRYRLDTMRDVPGRVEFARTNPPRQGLDTPGILVFIIEHEETVHLRVLSAEVRQIDEIVLIGCIHKVFRNSAANDDPCPAPESA